MKLQPSQFSTGLGGNPEPRQLKMFMTGNEIMGEYQALDGDKQDSVQDVAMTNQKVRSNEYRPEWAGSQSEYRQGQSTGGTLYNRFPGGVAKREVEHLETSQDVFKRKAEESTMPMSQYDQEIHAESKHRPDLSDVPIGSSRPSQRTKEGTNTFEDRENSYFEGKEMAHDQKYESAMDTYHSESMYDSIKRDGVQKPISLADPGQKALFGSEGKPMVLGGHHRLGAQFEQDPNKLMPVIHHRDIWEAKDSKGYKYS